MIPLAAQRTDEHGAHDGGAPSGVTLTNALRMDLVP